MSDLPNIVRAYVPTQLMEELDHGFAKLTAKRDALLANAMTEEKAREVLWGEIDRDEVLMSQRIDWVNAPSASLHGYFTALQLRAIAWWMENKGEGK